MKMNTRIARGTAVLALVALAAAPMSAWAVPGNSHAATKKAPKISAKATPKKLAKAAERTAAKAVRLAGKQKALTDRMNKVLANRERAFNVAADQISRRIEAVASLATTVAAAGGDVTGVLVQLDAARAKVAEAKAAEVTAAEMFRAVLTATDKKAAFKAAKAQAHAARVMLSDSRALLRNAILSLEVVVNGLTPVTPVTPVTPEVPVAPVTP